MIRFLERVMASYCWTSEVTKAKVKMFRSGKPENNLDPVDGINNFLDDVKIDRSM